jgi:hypothetical protein
MPEKGGRKKGNLNQNAESVDELEYWGLQKQVKESQENV